jgi:hypothetical protein
MLLIASRIRYSDPSASILINVGLTDSLLQNASMATVLTLNDSTSCLKKIASLSRFLNELKALYFGP